MASVVHTQNGDSTTVYDGREGWIASPNNPVMLLPLAAGAESDGARLDAQLFFPAEIRQALSQWRAGFPQTSVGDKDVDVIEGSAPGRTRVKLFFDQQTGLLDSSVALRQHDRRNESLSDRLRRLPRCKRRQTASPMDSDLDKRSIDVASDRNSGRRRDSGRKIRQTRAGRARAGQERGSLERTL